TGAGTDLKYLISTRQVKQLGHTRDDKRLRDRLPAGNRQRVVFIGLSSQRFRNKEMTGQAVHRVEDLRVGDSIMIAQTLDHSKARNGKFVGDVCPKRVNISHK